MDKTPEQEEAPEHKVKYPFSGVALHIFATDRRTRHQPQSRVRGALYPQNEYQRD